MHSIRESLTSQFWTEFKVTFDFPLNWNDLRLFYTYTFKDCNKDAENNTGTGGSSCDLGLGIWK